MKIYTIREVSKLLDLPPSTLRYYEEVGILSNVKKNSSGQRIYEESHIHRLFTIICFKRTGMSISKIQSFFIYEEDKAANIDNLIDLLNNQKKQVDEQIKGLIEDIEHVQKKIIYYRGIKNAIDNDRNMPNWNEFKDLEIKYKGINFD
jgi:Predicted transcriptional regulators